MIKAILTWVMLFGIVFYLIASVIIRDFCNNRDQKKRVITVVKSENDERVIGDGAWQKRASWPSERMRRLREIEPRGA